MRITFVLPPIDMSGGNRVTAIYAEALQQRGHDVTIVHLPRQRPSIINRLRRLVYQHKWRFTPTPPASHFYNKGLKIHMIDRPRPVVEADVPDADVVIATWWETAHWVNAFGPQKGAKVYFMQDYGAPNQPLEKVRQTWNFPMRMITVSSWLRDQVTEFNGRTPDLIANAVDTHTFTLPPRPKPTRPTVGFLYSWAPQKGSDICINAIRILREKEPDLRVVSFGPRAPHKMLPLPPGAEFHENAADSELRDIYSACTVWLFGTRREGFGLPILEAMASRTPVVATPAGAAPDYIDKTTGILVPPDDPDAMAQAAQQILDLAPADWQTMSQACFDRVSGYSWEDAVDRFEQVLLEAAQPRS